MTLRLYVDLPLAASAPELTLPAGAARHVQVRRAQPGDAVVLFDGRGGEWDAVVTAMGRQQVDVRLGERHEVERELAPQVTLALGMPANERMDALVEKATELGVARIVPLLTQRSVLRLEGERALRRRAHWQAIAVAAAEQCGRVRVPEIEPVQPLRAWLERRCGPHASAGQALPALRWLLSPGAAPAAHPQGAASVCTLSGPEGGLDDGEQGQARAAGFAPVGLGPRVLRADTAPLAVLAWLGLGG